MFLDEIPDYLALGITTEYQRIKMDYAKTQSFTAEGVRVCRV